MIKTMMNDWLKIYYIMINPLHSSSPCIEHSYFIIFAAFQSSFGDLLSRMSLVGCYDHFDYPSQFIILISYGPFDLREELEVMWCQGL